MVVCRFGARHAFEEHTAEVSTLQSSSDRLIDRKILRYIPPTVRPNTVTVVRFVLTPILVLLYVGGLIWAAVLVFIVAASTDFIDGAMARTRDQITPLGTVIDPVADKLLIGALLVCVGWEYLVVKIIVVTLAVEMVSVLAYFIVFHKTRRTLAANWFGKLKMIVQTFGLFFFLLGRLLDFQPLVTLAVLFLWVSLVLALISAVLQIRDGNAAGAEGRKAPGSA